MKNVIWDDILLERDTKHVYTTFEDALLEMWQMFPDKENG